VTRSGANLASLTDAIQERMSALCDADLLVQRSVRDTLAALNDLGEPLAVVVALDLPQPPSRTCTSPLGSTREGIRER